MLIRPRFGERLATAAVLAALVVVPLVFSNRLFSQGYIIPKNAALQLLGALALLAIMLAVAGDSSHLAKGLLLSSALLLLSQLASIPFTLNRGLCVSELLRVLALLSLMAATSIAARTGRAERLAALVLVTATVVSLLGILHFWTRAIFPAIHDSYGFEMLGATLGHDNFAGQFLIAALPLGLAIVGTQIERSRVASALLALLACCTIVFFLSITFSRGAWLGLLASLAAFAAFWLLRWRSVTTTLSTDNEATASRRKRLLAASFAVLFLGVAVLSFSLNRREKGISAMQKARQSVDLADAPIAFRLKLWQGAIQLLKEHPVLGTGCGSFAMYYPSVRLPEEHEIAGLGISVRSPHNDYIKLATESGLLGLVASAYLLLTVARPFLRRLRTRGAGTELPLVAIGAASAILASLVHAFFSSNFTMPSSAMMLAVNMGLLAGVVKQKGDGMLRISGPSKSAAVAVLAVLTLLLMVIPVRFLIADYNFKKAQLLAAKGNPSEAKAALHKAISAADYYIEPKILLGNLYIKAEEYQQAIDVLRPARAICPYWPQVLNNIGVAYSQRAAKTGDPGSHAEAYLAFKTAVELAPRFQQAWLNYGAALQTSGDFRGAEEAFRRALSLSPDDIAASSKLAETLMAQNKPPEAEQVLNSSLKAHPDDPNLHNNLGLVLLAQGKEDDAIEAFELAAKLSTRLFEPHLNLGRLYENRSEIDKAIDHYRIALQRKPDLEVAKMALERLSSRK